VLIGQEVIRKKKGNSVQLDHLTILSRDFERSALFYDLLLPLLGFEKQKRGIWKNEGGLYLQFREAQAETSGYERYAPGLNHFGFSAPDRAAVDHVHGAMTKAGFEVRLQEYPDGTYALFMPDPDGLRVEFSHYPPGVPAVD
jgi:lactoylglutathione lyase